MTYSTINQCARDVELQDRVIAGVQKEVIANEAFGNTPFGQQVRSNPGLAVNIFMYPISVDNEADYEYAVGAGNEHPGLDPGVIGDDEIQSGIQTHWPDAPVAEPRFEEPAP